MDSGKEAEDTPRGRPATQSTDPPSRARLSRLELSVSPPPLRRNTQRNLPREGSPELASSSQGQSLPTPDTEQKTKANPPELYHLGYIEVTLIGLGGGYAAAANDLKVNSAVKVERSRGIQHNPNFLAVTNMDGATLGHVNPRSADTLSPLIDKGDIVIDEPTIQKKLGTYNWRLNLRLRTQQDSGGQDSLKEKLEKKGVHVESS